MNAKEQEAVSLQANLTEKQKTPKCLQDKLDAESKRYNDLKGQEKST